MKSSQYEILSFDELAECLRVGKRTPDRLGAQRGDSGVQSGSDVAVSAKRLQSLNSSAIAA